jgi:anti-sigma factor RsiW
VSHVLPDHLSCKELVELVTSYLEGELSEDERVRFEQHLAACDACITYVDQMRGTVRALGGLSEESLDEPVKKELMSAFRAWKAKAR